MTKAAENLFNSVFRGVREATESNLKLQQELLVGWTRFFPGFSGRQYSSQDNGNLFQHQLRNNILNVAQTQRELIGQQFDAAIASFDLMMGAS